MNKILRLFSTLLLLFGIAAITYYVLFCGETTGVELLSQPSYYVRQSLWFIFLTGAAVTGLSVLANFFSWNRKGEKKEEELKNAGFVEHEEIEAWLGETVSPDGKGKTTDPEETRSGDTEKIEAADSTERLNGQAEQSADETERLTAGEGETEILPREEKEGETEILPREEKEEETEILPKEEKEGETEILPREEKEEETEILPREEEAVVWDEAPEEEEPFELLPEFRRQKKAEEESGRPETEEEEIPEEAGSLPEEEKEEETEILPKEEKEEETEILPKEEKEETEILLKEKEAVVWDEAPEEEEPFELLPEFRKQKKAEEESGRPETEEEEIPEEAGSLPEEEKEETEILPKEEKEEETEILPKEEKEAETEFFPEEGDPELRTVFLGKNEAPERVDQRTAQQRMDTLPDGRPRWAEDGTEILYAEYPRDEAAASRPRYWTEDGTEILNYDRMGAPAASERGGTV